MYILYNRLPDSQLFSARHHKMSSRYIPHLELNGMAGIE